MPALEIISGATTAAGGTLSPIVMAAGNSLTVRNAVDNSKIRLLAAWSHMQAEGSVRIRSPLLHDNVQGIRFVAIAGSVTPPFMPPGGQALQSQDTLIVENTGSGTAGDVEIQSLLLHYENLPGVIANLITPAEMMERASNFMSVSMLITPTAAGQWSGERLFTSAFDLTKTQRDYALYGYKCSANCGAIRVRGVDVGNLGVGGPGTTDTKTTAKWFADLSIANGIPLVPVINSSNKSTVFVDIIQNELLTAVWVDLLLVEMGPKTKVK